jgi:trans-aconitate methyltransferase
MAPSALVASLTSPLCSSVEMWSTTYFLQLRGDDAVYEYMRPRALSRLLRRLAHDPAAASSAAAARKAAESAAELDASFRKRLASAFPPACPGTTLLPVTRFFLVARRPSLLDVYKDYATYHDHQLTKGWKS